jgi:pimeloyl-ACP methyl ester carboxylesterase
MRIAPEEHFADVGDVRLCYEPFGDPSAPAVLMVMGLGTQMLGWHADLCREIAGRGFHVIRFDNRDVGRSTRLDDHPPPRPRELVLRRIRRPAYTLDDMADDAIGLLGALGIERAHVVGASMGGMIAQVAAGRHPERVLSLTSVMSTTGNRWKGQPAVRLYPYLLARPPRSKEQYVRRLLRLFRVVGSTGFRRDEQELRAIAELAWDRGPSPAGLARQLGAIIAAGDRTAALRRIEAPTIVVHGTDDKLVRPSGGRATAEAIPHAELRFIEGMGHDMPRGAWPQITGAIVDNATRAGERDERAAA